MSVGVLDNTFECWGSFRIIKLNHFHVIEAFEFMYFPSILFVHNDIHLEQIK